MSKLDALIKASLLREDEALLLIADATEEHSFSPAFDKALDAKMHAAPKRPRNLLRRVVAVAVAAALLVGSAFAFWDELIGLFVTAFPQYAEMRIEPSIVPREAFNTFPTNWTGLWIPEYMTDGYTFSSATERLDVKCLGFVSTSDTVLLFEQCYQQVIVFGDNQGVSVPNVFVSGYLAHAFEKEVDSKMFRRLAWTDGTSYFSISGFCSFEELSKIGGSIMFCEIGER